MKRGIITIFMLSILALAPASAQAYLFPDFGITSLQTYLDGEGGYTAADYSAYTYSGPFVGLYTVTALATEATHTDYFYDMLGGTALFNNQDSGTFGASAGNIDLNLAYFLDSSSANIFSPGTAYKLDNSAAVAFYQLDSDWVVPELGISLTAGTLIFGLNDSATVDGDFDDLILAATINPTPIPGAVWLLGAGLMGLLGIRRARNVD